jgi:hypothetical protein
VGRVGWTEGSSRTGDAHLYCFGIDHQNAPPIPSATGRIAFVSSAFTPGGGYQAADALCQSDASMARLSGTYLAFISTTMWAAADRFPPMDVPWIRPDHVPLETMNGQLLQGLPATPIALGPDGMPTGQVFRIWTGAPNPGARAVMADNCADWTSATAPSPIVGNNNDTGPGFFHLPSVTTSCAAANVHLYCLQMQ